VIDVYSLETEDSEEDEEIDEGEEVVVLFDS
jgi:hypothetical protein